MITFLTGQPGSGKTLYVVSKLLRGLIGTTVDEILDDGSVEKRPRVIYSNINGLQLDHELIALTGPLSLENWHEWAQPGAVIVVDEVQQIWKPRPNGSAVPPAVGALETHRHMGVDFIVMTQNPLLVDRNLLALVGRHLHVRRIANLPAAIVYEWDGCSRTLAFRNAANTTPWRYDRAAYRLYKSARAHTKQKRRLPMVVFVLLAAVIGCAVAFPKMMQSLVAPVMAANKPKGEVVATAGGTKTTTVTKDGKSVTTVTQAPARPASAPASPTPGLELDLTPTPSKNPRPAMSGCGMIRNVCRCYDGQGGRIEVKASVCVGHIEPAVPALPGQDPFFAGEIRPHKTSAEDLQLLQDVAVRKVVQGVRF